MLGDESVLSPLATAEIQEGAILVSRKAGGPLVRERRTSSGLLDREELRMRALAIARKAAVMDKVSILWDKQSEGSLLPEIAEFKKRAREIVEAANRRKYNSIAKPLCAENPDTKTMGCDSSPICEGEKANLVSLASRNVGDQINKDITSQGFEENVRVPEYYIIISWVPRKELFCMQQY
jgi:hypothetical protein